mmetsp:Transcript_67929/g.180775  ORF Transcript_67929/g.180775 Transcript_67929/m.180775 type:complete len:204 (-) Transcript_67929:18-629(-)
MIRTATFLQPVELCKFLFRLDRPKSSDILFHRLCELHRGSQLCAQRMKPPGQQVLTQDGVHQSPPLDAGDPLEFKGDHTDRELGSFASPLVLDLQEERLEAGLQFGANLLLQSISQLDAVPHSVHMLLLHRLGLLGQVRRLLRFVRRPLLLLLLPVGRLLPCRRGALLHGAVEHRRAGQGGAGQHHPAQGAGVSHDRGGLWRQ